MAKTKEKQNKKKNRNKPLSVKEATEKVNYIVENFDFHKVYNVMKSLKWRYFDFAQGGYYNPTIDQLKKTARYILTSVATDDQTTMATGGFMATRYEGGMLHLCFYISEQTSEFYEDGNPPEVMNELLSELEKRNLIETR